MVYRFVLKDKIDAVKDEMAEYAKKGYEGIISMLETDEDGYLSVGHVCIGTGVGDYEFYINRPVCNNDLHGLGAFLYMATEYSRALDK